jgi:hypothetical protein
LGHPSRKEARRSGSLCVRVGRASSRRATRRPVLPVPPTTNVVFCCCPLSVSISFSLLLLQCERRCLRRERGGGSGEAAPAKALVPLVPSSPRGVWNSDRRLAEARCPRNPLCRLVGEDRDARASRLRTNKFHPLQGASVLEEALPAARDNGMNHELELVEEVILQQRFGEQPLLGPTTNPSSDIPTQTVALLIQPLHSLPSDGIARPGGEASTKGWKRVEREVEILVSGSSVFCATTSCPAQTTPTQGSAGAARKACSCP